VTVALLSYTHKMWQRNVDPLEREAGRDARRVYLRARHAAEGGRPPHTLVGLEFPPDVLLRRLVDGAARVAQPERLLAVREQVARVHLCGRTGQ
jgi:hypothetical protein